MADPDLQIGGGGGGGGLFEGLTMNVDLCEDNILAVQRKCFIFEKIRGAGSWEPLDLPLAIMQQAFFHIDRGSPV